MPLHRITRLVVAGIASAAIVATPVGAIAAASAQPTSEGFSFSHRCTGVH